jgi:TonB family protein
VKWLKTVGLPLAYVAAVVWAMRPPAPVYVAGDKTVVTVKDTGGPELLHSPEAIYPAAALAKGIEGMVNLNVSVDGEGRVSKVEAASGPEELRQAAIDAVRQWQFTAVAAETQIQSPFLRWHPGSRTFTPPVVVERAPAVTVRGRHGTVRLVATVGAAGKVEEITPVSGPKRLLEAASQNVMLWSFRAAMRDGKPARATAVVEVTF